MHLRPATGATNTAVTGKFHWQKNVLPRLPLPPGCLPLLPLPAALDPQEALPQAPLAPDRPLVLPLPPPLARFIGQQALPCVHLPAACPPLLPPPVVLALTGRWRHGCCRHCSARIHLLQQQPELQPAMETVSSVNSLFSWLSLQAQRHGTCQCPAAPTPLPVTLSKADCNHWLLTVPSTVSTAQMVEYRVLTLGSQIWPW